MLSSPLCLQKEARLAAHLRTHGGHPHSTVPEASPLKRRWDSNEQLSLGVEQVGDEMVHGIVVKVRGGQCSLAGAI